MTSTGRLLYQAVCDPAGVVALIESPPLLQRRVLALAETERALPIIGAHLLSLGLRDPLPDSMVSFLAEAGRIDDLATASVAAYQANRQRTQHFMSQYAQLARWLDDARIAWVPLKGAALLADEVWPDAAQRVMTDIDILVLDPSHVEEAHNVLLDHGLSEPPQELRPVGSVLPDEHQLPALIHPEWVGSVEIHRTMVSTEFLDEFPSAEVSDRIVFTARGRRLDTADLALHIIFHARVSDWGHRSAALGLRSLLDVAHLLRAQPTIADEIMTRTMSRRVKRSVRTHVDIAQFTAAQAKMAMPLRSRPWWWWALTVARSPRTQELWRNVALLGVYLRPERMRARAGGAMAAWRYPSFVATTVWAKIRETLTRLRRS